MTVTTTTTYTTEETAAYHKGREAHERGEDYFSNPHFAYGPRDNFLRRAWEKGWLSVGEHLKLKSEQLDEVFGDADESIRSIENS
jgi:hypothetical protein